MRDLTPTIRNAVVISVLVLVTGCASSRPATCHPGETSAISESLYFGTARPDGVVSPEEWQTFVANEVTPRFPNGLTSWQASGQWLSATGALHQERSYVLYVVHPDAPEYERSILEIIDRYRTAFQQEAVLRVRTTVCMSL